MKLSEIYRAAIEAAIDADPRSREEVEAELKREKERFEKLSEDEQELYDRERLENPYSDTRILWGDPGTEVESVMAGIDIEAAELLVADRLRERGRRVDLALTHHPEGIGLTGLPEVMKMQADAWEHYGVPINIGESLIDKRRAEVRRSLLPANHNRAVDTARLLDIPYMCAHTVADNLVAHFLQERFDSAGVRTLGDIVKSLKELPEYREAARLGVGPTVLVGSDDRRTGKVWVDMTGGTEGPEGVVAKLAAAGVGTLVGMHMSDKLREKAEENGLNVVIAGHIASDGLGLNLLLDRLEAQGVEIIPAAGLVRASRT